MLSALILTRLGYPAVRLAAQLANRRSVHHGPLVLVTAPLKTPAPTIDRDRTYDSLLAMGVLFATPVPAVIYGRIKRGMLGTLAIAVIFALSMYYLAVSANNPFLYFNF